MLRTEELVLKRNISKLKTTEIFQVLSDWSYLSLEDVDHLRSNLEGKPTKQMIAHTIWECCSKKPDLNLSTVGELELLCIQVHSSKRQWNAYQLSAKQGKSPADITAPKKLKQKLMKLFRLYFSKECCTSVLLHHGLLWGWVYLPKPGSRAYEPTRCLYFVHYPGTPVVIFSGMKAAFADFMTHCLVVALGYQKITEMSLSGRHIESLAELAINKLAEGGFTKFQKTHRPNGPLGLTTTRKRKAPDLPVDSCVTDEDRAAKRQRLDQITDSFGEHEQPTLEKVEFRVELPYRSKTIAPSHRPDGSNFHSRVKFVGKNALEGIRNLAERGYARVPLPKHLTCVPSRARNYFLLTKAQKTNQTVQNPNVSRNSSNVSPRKTNKTKSKPTLSAKPNNQSRSKPRASPTKNNKARSSPQNTVASLSTKKTSQSRSKLSVSQNSSSRETSALRRSPRVTDNKQNTSRSESDRKTTRRSVSGRS